MIKAAVKKLNFRSVENTFKFGFFTNYTLENKYIQKKRKKFG